MNIDINRNIRMALVAGVLSTNLFAACKTATNKNATSNEVSGSSDTQKRISDTFTAEPFKKRKDVVVAEPYYSYLKCNYAVDLKESSIIYFEEKDMDLDGQNEAMVGIGLIRDNVAEKHKYAYIDKIVVLRNNHGHVGLIGDIESRRSRYDMISLRDARFISFQGDRQSYIYLPYDNSYDLIGFDIYRLAKNKIKLFEHSISVTKQGNDELTDTNHDGIFEGYVQNRYSYDVYYYEVASHYQYKNGAFAFSDAQVDLPAYPDSVDEVISQYMTLRLLWERYDYKLSSALQRLSALCQTDSLLKTPWDSESWSAFYLVGINDEGNIKLEQAPDKAVATVTYTDNDTHKETTLTFQLFKTDGKWQIVNIKETK